MELTLFLVFELRTLTVLIGEWPGADNSYANIPTTPYELPDGQ